MGRALKMRICTKWLADEAWRDVVAKIMSENTAKFDAKSDLGCL
jgi:hypothetical protein